MEVREEGLEDIYIKTWGMSVRVPGKFGGKQAELFAFLKDFWPEDNCRLTDTDTGLNTHPVLGLQPGLVHTSEKEGVPPELHLSSWGVGLHYTCGCPPMHSGASAWEQTLLIEALKGVEPESARSGDSLGTQVLCPVLWEYHLVSRTWGISINGRCFTPTFFSSLASQSDGYVL